MVSLQNLEITGYYTVGMIGSVSVRVSINVKVQGVYCNHVVDKVYPHLKFLST